MSLRKIWYWVQLGFLLVTSRWKARRCASVGLGLRVQGRLFVRGEGKVRLGDRVRINGSHVPVELGTFPNGLLSIGAHSFVNSGTSICASKLVTIGENCAIGNYCLIMDTDFHTVGDHIKMPESRPITIEDNVWIASRVTILKGVRVGHNAVIAAGAVVTKDVAPYTLVGGIPARLIRVIEDEFVSEKV